jgi:hypothetical protein
MNTYHAGISSVMFLIVVAVLTNKYLSLRVCSLIHEMFFRRVCNVRVWGEDVL